MSKLVAITHLHVVTIRADLSDSRASSKRQQVAIKECERYIEVIRKKIGPEPDGARLWINWEENSGEGACLEVICFYDPEIQISVDYAFACEAEGRWVGKDNCRYSTVKIGPDGAAIHSMNPRAQVHGEEADPSRTIYDNGKTMMPRLDQEEWTTQEILERES
jgi:hypothetical protein